MRTTSVILNFLVTLKKKEIGKMNVNNIFLLPQYIQNIIIICNQYKNY